MRACLKASGFEMKSVEGGTIVVTRDEDTQKFLDTRDQCRSTTTWSSATSLVGRKVVQQSHSMALLLTCTASS